MPVIGFAGLSHLGIVSSLAAAAKGFEVVAFDADAVLVDALSHGRLPIVEPGLTDLLTSVHSRVTFTADPAALGRCDVIYVSADVPVDDAGQRALAPVTALLDVVTANCADDAIIVILSQVDPGFTRGRQPLVEIGRRRLLCQVETLVVGNAVERALRPERVIVGCPDPARPLPPPLARFLGAFDCPILPMGFESAELAKIAINLFLVSTATTTNMLAEACEAIGANWHEIAPAIRLDQRIGPHAYLTPGLGLGGVNLLRDMVAMRALATTHGVDATIVDAWLAQSSRRRAWALATLRAELPSGSATPTIAIWGLAYKENTSSVRNSPGVALVHALKDFRRQAFDPAATVDLPGDPLFTQVADPMDAVQGADALIIATPWPSLSAIDPLAIRAAMRGRLIIDPFGVLAGPACADAGLNHRRLGVGKAGAF